MHQQIETFLSQSELAKRWGRSEAAIGSATSVGAGPRSVNIDGTTRYPFEEVQPFERSCLFFEPADVAMRTAS
jgi:hypothetical protein